MRPPFKRVYVEITSPFPKASSTKENVSLSSPNSFRGLAILKRKRSQLDELMLHKNEVPQTLNDGPPSKRIEVTPTTVNKVTKAVDLETCDEPASTQLHRCHQCTRQFPSTNGVHCTFNRKGSRCGIKYCTACLKNRYNLNIECIKVSGASSDVEGQHLHIQNAPFVFKCPRCSGTCNCRACRKSKGLEATGQFRRTDSVSSSVKPGVSRPSSLSEGPDARHVFKAQASKQLDQMKPARSASVHARAQVPTVKRVASCPPPPMWTPLSVPQSLTYKLTEDRLFIREFGVRFANLLDMPSARVDELDCIGGEMLGAVKCEEDVSEELISWVSEVCVRDMLSGLLGLLAEDAEDEVKRAISRTSKTIRNSSANLARIWSTLATLRDEHGNDVPWALSFPNPLPTPVNTAKRSLRETSTTSAGVHVAHSAQFVPVVTALIEAACQSSTVREELDRASDELKEIQRRARDAQKVLQEKWRAEGATKNKDKLSVTARKVELASIDTALRVLTSFCDLRSGPLGTDHDGRMYWALAPGAAEHEASLNLLKCLSNVNSSGSRSRRAQAPKKVPVPSESRRAEMKRWTWCIAIWGKNPVPLCTKSLGEDEIDKIDGDVERWWGFWKPDDVRTLARWIEGARNKDQIEDASDKNLRASSVANMDRLSAALTAYAGLLECRTREGSDVATFGKEGNTNNKDAAVKASSFYG